MKNKSYLLFPKVIQNITIISLLIGLLSVVSCQKQRNIVVRGNGEKVVLKLSVSGIMNDNKVFSVGADMASSDQTTKEIKINGVNASLKSSQGNPTVVNSVAKRAADDTSPMQDGMTYRILFYYDEDGEFATSSIAKSGEEIEIEVEGDQKYNWYAYSYNDSSDIPLPDTQNPEISTPTDRDLIYDKGSVFTSKNENFLSVTFEHKLSLIELQVNAEGMYSEIVDIECSLATASWFNQGTFNIRSGMTENLAQLGEIKLDLSNLDATNNLVKVARVYTADANDLQNVTINLDHLVVKYPNDKIEELVPQGDTQKVVFESFSPGSGIKYNCEIILWKILNRKSILHLCGNCSYGLTAESAASYNMIRSQANFGVLPNSVVKIKGFDHTIEKQSDHNLLQYLNSSTKPDIIIMESYDILEEEMDPLLNYVEIGGSVLIFTNQFAGNEMAKFTHEEFLRRSLNEPTLTFYYSGKPGMVLPFNGQEINDNNINGPFGDVRNGNLGIGSNAYTYFQNIDFSKITVYSYSKPLNYDEPSPPDGVTMFQHNTKNIFWVGDGNWLSNYNTNGTPISLYANPFATTIDNSPIINRSYGQAGDGFDAGSWGVSNSIFFANLMHSIVVQAEFFGINTIR